MKQTSLPSTWRKIKPLEKLPNDIPPYPATRFFDQLSFIGDANVCCFLLETTEGLVLLDCMNPDQRCVDIIEQGITQLGHDPSELIAILITHGHGDHWGKADYFREKYGCVIYMGERDYIDAQNLPDVFPWRLEYTVDRFLEDMGTYTFGGTTITTVLTPGHTSGCMSFIIPVTDEGEPHLIALWGGTALLPTADAEAYMESALRFGTICEEMGVDGEISNHPITDSLIQRLEVVNNIAAGIPNPFVLGKENYQKYHSKFYAMAKAEKERRDIRVAQGLPPAEWLFSL